MLQLPAGAALLPSLMRANVLMVGKTFLTQGHALEKKDMAFLPGTQSSSGCLGSDLPFVFAARSSR